jgi:hypothetical protein
MFDDLLIDIRFTSRPRRPPGKPGVARASRKKILSLKGKRRAIPAIRFALADLVPRFFDFQAVL